ncbi:MAG: hypothetical protein J6Q30_04855 [Oscillospiraceae bacterium]|nr:hypothetical protein [Oscillospiraceae bacterium]
MKKFVLFSLLLTLSLMLCACSDSQPEENAHQHSYVQGVCSSCAEAQPGYKPLLSCSWSTAGLTPDGEELDVISLWFYEWGYEIDVSYYGPLEGLDQEDQDYYLNNEPDNLFDFEGKKYYHLGIGTTRDMKCTEQGDTAEITVKDGMIIGVIKMVRTAANQYTVTEVSGTIIDSVITSCLKVGSVFTAEE